MRRLVVVAGVVLVLVAVCVVAAYALQRGDSHRTAKLTVTWGGGEAHPCCVYDPDAETVDATILIDGSAAVDRTVTVTAYADENTSQPVGSSSHTIPAGGQGPRSFVVTIPVEKAPFVDDDGVVSCRMSVS